MRILVVGVGAIGGYFGGRLLAAKRDVTFLVRPHRAAQLASSGLEVQSPRGDLHLNAPPTILPGAIHSPFDLILLSCKAQDLAGALDALAPAVESATTILPLLNGMHHLEVLDERFGRDRILGGTCFISATRQQNGRIIHLNDLDRLSFGERDGASSDRIQRIAAALSSANFDSHPSEKILPEMWQKWVQIATMAGINSLMRASIGDIVAADASYLALQLLAECAAIAAREGFPPTSAFMDKTSAILTTAGSPLKASMLRDIENNAPIESHQIIGDLIRRGAEHHLATPLLEMVYAHLRSYEQGRSRDEREKSIAI